MWNSFFFAYVSLCNLCMVHLYLCLLLFISIYLSCGNLKQNSRHAAQVYIYIFDWSTIISGGHQSMDLASTIMLLAMAMEWTLLLCSVLCVSCWYCCWGCCRCFQLAHKHYTAIGRLNNFILAHVLSAYLAFCFNWFIFDYFGWLSIGVVSAS